MLLGLTDREFAEVKDRSSQYGGSVAVANTGNEMIESARSARSDHGHANSVRYRAREADIESDARAIAVHGGKQDFARPQPRYLPGIVNRVNAGRVTSAMRKNLPSV